MDNRKQENKPAKAQLADDFLAEFRSDPERNRLFLESEIRLDICECMRSFRKAIGLRQEDLASRVGVSQSLIAKLERGGYSRIGFDNLRTYARAMGYDVDISTMFQRLPEASFTGRSSYDELPGVLTFSNFATACLANWSAQSDDQTPRVATNAPSWISGAAA